MTKMWELNGEQRLNSTVLSMVIRAFFLVLILGGWAAFVMTYFQAPEWMPETVWYVGMGVVMGFPALWLTHRIEQYWLYAVWGISIARSANYFLRIADDPTRLAWKTYVLDDMKNEKSEVLEAMNSRVPMFYLVGLDEKGDQYYALTKSMDENRKLLGEKTDD